MSNEVSVLLAFCEGQHDVAFVSNVMKHFFGFKREKWKFSEYPAPFNELFRGTVEEHAIQDFGLDDDKPFLPSQVLSKDDRVILLFGCGGDRSDKVKRLLSKAAPLLENAKVFPGDAVTIATQARYLFIYDADVNGLKKIHQQTLENFAVINTVFDGEEMEVNWLPAWVADEENPFAATYNDKAIYVWGSSPECGTLEDLLYPLFEESQPTLFAQASQATDTMFTCWDISNADSSIAIPATSRRYKSIFTIMGQGKKPGGAMSVIVDQAKLIKQKNFQSNLAVKAFADFIARFVAL